MLSPNPNLQDLQQIAPVVMATARRTCRPLMLRRPQWCSWRWTSR